MTKRFRRIVNSTFTPPRKKRISSRWIPIVLVFAVGLTLASVWNVFHSFSIAIHGQFASNGLPSKKQLCQNPSKIWAGLSESLRSKSRVPALKAALYTPYNIVPGGGERYLLSAAAVFQALNFHVLLLTSDNNVCKTKSMLLEVVEALEVPLNPSKLSYERVADIRRFSLRQAARFEVFFLLGNEKLPQFSGLGKVNLYMCQFPFDLNRKNGMHELNAFSTYDNVLVNSRYTYRHYNKYTQSAFLEAGKVNLPTPLVSLLYPPVAERMYDSLKKITVHRKDIIMIGRIFDGRQNKGYRAALSMFQQVMQCTEYDVRLHIVGSLMPGHEEFYQILVTTVRRIGLNVDFHINAHQSEIMDILSKSLVQWHLTGIDSVEQDPASEEHFGVSVVEGMQAGVIPVVINKGGLGEIVQNGSSGFIGASKAEVVHLTCALFQKPSSHLLDIGKEAQSSAKAFSYDRFQKSLCVLVQRAFLSKPFQHLVSRTSHIVRSSTFNLPAQADKIALIIEDRQHFALEYIIKNVLYHLGHGWGLVVVHTQTNEVYVHERLTSIKNVTFVKFDVDYISIDLLNKYLKNTSSWAFTAEKVLFFQTDSLLLHGNITNFLEYDYIGAPWHLENERWSMMQNAIPTGVGNGGLSLRSTAAMRKIAREFGHLSPTSENEDLFFVKHMQNSAYRLPSRAIAYDFALEVPCIDLEMKKDDMQLTAPHRHHEGPLALHAAWYYMTDIANMKKLLRFLEYSLCSESSM